MSRDHTIGVRTMPDRPVIAAFRPNDDRAEAAISDIEAVGGEALLDPMIEPRPTGSLPRHDAEITILTSRTAAAILDAEGWTPDATTIAAIGPKTATALEGIGIDVDVIPETYTSTGLVDALEDVVPGRTVEIARSDHGSDALIDGLWAAGAYVHETVLYELVRPKTAGRSVDALLDGSLDGLAFSSSLTVEHFLETARERGEEAAVRSRLDEVCVGAIGPPTAETARSHQVSVDVCPESSTFADLVEAIAKAL